MTKQYQAHLIPTDKESKIALGKNNMLINTSIAIGAIQNRNDDFFNHHIYLTSSTDEIKKGDFCFDTEHIKIYEAACDDFIKTNRDLKIIASTDKQCTPNSWLPLSAVEMIVEYYNKHGKCMEFVELEMEEHENSAFGYNGKDDGLYLKINTDGSVIVASEKDIYKIAEELVKNHKDFSAEGYSEYMNGYHNGIIEGLQQKDRSVIVKANGEDEVSDEDIIAQVKMIRADMFKGKGYGNEFTDEQIGFGLLFTAKWMRDRLTTFSSASNENDGWISCKERQPDIGDEYNVVYDLEDGEPPLTSTMEWNAIDKKWIDIIGASTECLTVLYWQPLPKPGNK